MDTKSLSYDELGEALGITAASAKRLAIRRRWPKSLGNDGRARVTVPVEYLEAAAGDDASDAAGDVPEVDAGDTAGDVARDEGDAVRAVAGILGVHIDQLRGDLQTVRARLAEVEGERDAERARAGQVDVLREVLEVERRRTDDERRRAEELRAERDRWQEMATRPTGFTALLRRLGGGRN